VAYSKKNFKEPLWRTNNVWVRVPKQESSVYVETLATMEQM